MLSVFLNPGDRIYFTNTPSLWKWKPTEMHKTPQVPEIGVVELDVKDSFMRRVKYVVVKKEGQN